MAGKCACPHGCNAECDEQARCPICWNGGKGCPLLLNLPVSKEWLARALAEAKDQERFRKQYLGNWPTSDEGLFLPKEIGVDERWINELDAKVRSACAGSKLKTEDI
jgi:hypothetical protein